LDPQIRGRKSRIHGTLFLQNPKLDWKIETKQPWKTREFIFSPLKAKIQDQAPTYNPGSKRNGIQKIGALLTPFKCSRL